MAEIAATSRSAPRFFTRKNLASNKKRGKEN
jgi:hypothetical protein